MPHKHTRKGTADRSTLDLPPTIVAEPLPVSKSAAENNPIFTTTTKRLNKKRRRNADAQDDTPKAFARLMAFQQGKKLPKGLDDGAVKPTNKKAKMQAETEPEQEEGTTQIPTIKPGERMAEFSARVDAALPVSGLINKTARGGKDPLGLKVGRTHKEKKMHKMYAEWREAEKRIQERREVEREDREMEALEEGKDGQVVWADGSKKKMKGKKGKRKTVGENDVREEDPWERIKRERGGKIAFGDVVQAPPTFTKSPKTKFKVRGAVVDVGDVPKASGSLRKREELGAARKSIVEGYRQMMKGNGAKMEA